MYSRSRLHLRPPAKSAGLSRKALSASARFLSAHRLPSARQSAPSPGCRLSASLDRYGDLGGAGLAGDIGLGGGGDVCDKRECSDDGNRGGVAKKRGHRPSHCRTYIK
jgi:hypothetical protein